MSPKDPEVVEPLSDAEWNELRKFSGLPDEARASIDGVIRFLHKAPSLQHPRIAPTRLAGKAITSAKKAFSRLPTILDRLIETRAYRSLVRPLEFGPDNNVSGIVLSRDELTRLREEVRALADMLEVAEKRLPKFKPGRHAGHLGEAIRALNELMLEATGKAMNTAKHGTGDKIDFVTFVRKVTKKARMRVKDSTIRNEIKEANPFRRPRRRKMKSLGKKVSRKNRNVA